MTVTVVDPSTDADNNTPTAKAQTVNKGATPDPKQSIDNPGSLPNGTTFAYKDPVDTTTAGNKSAVVVVTYPDGSKDEVPVKVTVKAPRTDADKNTPVAKDQTVKPGDQPNAKDSIGNVGDLPSGTTFEYKTPVDTTTEGEKDAIVVVTYPDGSKDEVPVKVTVKAPHANTDKNTPTSKDQTVNKVETPDAKNSEKEIQVQKVSVSDKKAESAKLPNTGEEQSTSIALLGAVLGMFGLAGLAKRKKNED